MCKRQKNTRSLFIMKTKIQILTSSLALTIALSMGGCSTWRKLNKTEQGAVIGGGTGAVVGNIVAPGVGGTLVGGGIGALGGGLIGNEVDKNKRNRD